MARKKTKSKPAGLEAIRKPTGPAVRNLKTTPEDAARLVALGWQPVSQDGEQVILTADADAEQAWQDMHDKEQSNA